MNYCNIILRTFHSKTEFRYEILGVSLNVFDVNIIIEEDKNKRWIKETKNKSFNDWVISDNCKYVVIYSTPIYGVIENKKYCNLIKEKGLKFCAAFIDESDYQYFINKILPEVNEVINIENIELIRQVELFH
jgi:hypothetical protein